MDEEGRRDEVNPYESPRHISRFHTLQELARLAWIKDRMALWGCGLLVFFTIWGTMMLAVAVRWLWQEWFG